MGQLIFRMCCLMPQLPKYNIQTYLSMQQRPEPRNKYNDKDAYVHQHDW